MSVQAFQRMPLLVSANIILADYLSWLSKTLTEALSHATCSLSIELRMYLTAPSTKTSSSNASNASEKCDHSAVKTTTMMSPTEYHPSLKLVHGRPDIRRVLHDEIAACTDGGPISVDGQHPFDEPLMSELTIVSAVAGPAGLTSAVRRALCSDVAAPRAVLKGFPSVTLHVETFGM